MTTTQTSETVVPLSANQQFLFMFDQGEEAGSFGPYHHIAAGWRVRGAIDTARLQAALDAVVVRHEALRTVIVRDAEQPYQRICAPGSVRLDIIDHPEPDESRRDLRAQWAMNDLEAGRFSINDLPLLRAVLVRLAPDDAVLGLQAHHSAADAWSMQIIMRDVANLYAAAAGFAVPELPEVAQYAEFARLQHELVAEDVDREYWRATLDGAELLALPTDWPRSAGLPKASSWHRFTINPETTASVLSIARQTRSTPFIVLLAAYCVTVQRAFGRADVTVPTFSPGRGLQRFQESVGSFYNFLPLRVQLSGAASFREVILRTRAACLGAYEHELLFGQVVQDTQAVAAPMADDNLAAFVFQVERTLFSAEGTTVGDLNFTEIRRNVSSPVGGDIPDGALWTLSVEAGGDTVGTLAVNSNRYDSMTAAAMVLDFKRTVTDLLAGPDADLTA
ncbi:condensation domain-containing protein [Dactylosporangium sp. CS-033363]|uniref:condensation domain-containing protein n=1 Tax=Dactylosporangium sp. CS-033363 TaxID=3239935 RepID=UPI003D8C91EB